MEDCDTLTLGSLGNLSAELEKLPSANRVPVGKLVVYLDNNGMDNAWLAVKWGKQPNNLHFPHDGENERRLQHQVIALPAQIPDRICGHCRGSRSADACRTCRYGIQSQAAS